MEFADIKQAVHRADTRCEEHVLRLLARGLRVQEVVELAQVNVEPREVHRIVHRCAGSGVSPIDFRKAVLREFRKRGFGKEEAGLLIGHAESEV